jgi:hypothetical protein
MSLFLNLNTTEQILLEEQVDAFNAENFTRLTKQKFLIRLLKEYAARKAVADTGGKGIPVHGHK